MEKLSERSRRYCLRQRFRQRFCVTGAGVTGAGVADGVADRLARGAGFTSARYRRAVEPLCDFSISRMPK